MSKLLKLLGLSLLMALGTIQAITPEEQKAIDKAAKDFIAQELGSSCEKGTINSAKSKWEREIIKRNDPWRQIFLQKAFEQEFNKVCSENIAAYDFIATVLGSSCSPSALNKARQSWESNIVSQNAGWRKEKLRKALDHELDNACPSEEQKAIDKKAAKDFIATVLGSSCSPSALNSARESWERNIVSQNDDWRRKEPLRRAFLQELSKACPQ